MTAMIEQKNIERHKPANDGSSFIRLNHRFLKFICLSRSTARQNGLQNVLTVKCLSADYP